MSIRKEVTVKWGNGDPVAVEAFTNGNGCVLFGFECGQLSAQIAGTPNSMRAIAAMLTAVADEVEGRYPEPTRAVVAALADEMEPE